MKNLETLTIQELWAYRQMLLNQGYKAAMSDDNRAKVDEECERVLKEYNRRFPIKRTREQKHAY